MKTISVLRALGAAGALLAGLGAAQAAFLSDAQMFLDPWEVPKAEYEAVELDPSWDGSQWVGNSYAWAFSDVENVQVLPVLNPYDDVQPAVYPTSYAFTQTDYYWQPNTDYWVDLTAGVPTATFGQPGLFHVRLDRAGTENDVTYAVFVDAAMGGKKSGGSQVKTPGPKADLVIVSDSPGYDGFEAGAASIAEDDNGDPNVKRAVDANDCIAKIRAAATDPSDPNSINPIHVELVGHGIIDWPGSLKMGTTIIGPGGDLEPSAFQAEIDRYVDDLSIYACSFAKGALGEETLQTLADSIGRATAPNADVGVFGYGIFGWMLWARYWTMDLGGSFVTKTAPPENIEGTSEDDGDWLDPNFWRRWYIPEEPNDPSSPYDPNYPYKDPLDPNNFFGSNCAPRANDTVFFRNGGTATMSAGTSVITGLYLATPAYRNPPDPSGAIVSKDASVLQITGGSLALAGGSAYNLAGTLVAVKGTLTVGDPYEGRILQSGGTLTADHLSVTRGTVGLCAGHMEFHDSIRLGGTVDTRCELNVCGGSLSVGKDITLNPQDSGTAAVNISDGSITAQRLSVAGYQGQGTVNVAGGQFLLTRADSQNNFLGRSRVLPGGTSFTSGVGIVNISGGSFVFRPPTGNTTRGSFYLGWSRSKAGLDPSNLLDGISSTGIINITGGLCSIEASGTVASSTQTLVLGASYNNQPKDNPKGILNVTGGTFRTVAGVDPNTGEKVAPVHVILAKSPDSTGQVTIGGDALFSVDGNFDMEPNAAYTGRSAKLAVEVAAADNSLLIVSDMANVDDKLDVQTGSYRPRQGDKFTIIQSGLGVTGSFATITTNLTLGSAGFSGAVDANDYKVEFTGYTNGDAGQDGDVSTGDLSLLTGSWGETSGNTWADGDFNGDGAVDTGDLSLMAGNWGWVMPSPAPGQPVPEPATLALLALGAASLVRRRR